MWNADDVVFVDEFDNDPNEVQEVLLAEDMHRTEEAYRAEQMLDDLLDTIENA